MKSKAFGVIALIAIIGLSMAALSLTSCDNGTTPSGDTDLSGTITISPAVATTGQELTATYTGSEAVSYQWKNGTSNVGANSNKYIPVEAGSYTVTVSAEGYTSKTSEIVTVTVPLGPPPTDTTYFTFNKETGTITDYSDRGPKNVIIPSVIDGAPVAIISDNAFAGAWDLSTNSFLGIGLTSVIIPDSVTYIGEMAFYNNQLTTVTIGNSVTTIGQNAFAENQLTNVTIPDSVTSIGERAFYNNQLTSVTIGSSVTSIGNNAFRNNQLTSVTIPDSVTSIGDYAFYNNWLTSITLGANMSLNYDSLNYEFYRIYNDGGKEAGTYTRNNTNDTVWSRSSGDFMYNGTTTAITITGYTGSGGAVEIPATINGIPVTEIAEGSSSYNYLIGNWNISGVFAGKNLTSITIPDSVTSIGGAAFAYNELTNVTIPNSVTSIGDYAFGENQLTSITIGANVQMVFAYGYYSLLGSFGDNGFETVYDNCGKAAGTYTRPNAGSTTWGIYGTDYLINATGTITGYNGPGGVIEIPSTINDVPVTAIGQYAFYNNQLTNVTIPDSVTSIGQNAFAGNQLTSVTIPDSVTSIGEEAFAYNQLTSVIIPDSVTYIGGTAFRDNQLTSVIIPDSVTYIGELAFSDNQLTSVIIPDSVTYIGELAFSDNQLINVTIGNSVISIGNSAFYSNRNLTAINVSSGNTAYSSDDGVLYNKEKTTLVAWPPKGKIPVIIPNSVTSIGSYAFADNELTSVTIPDSVTSIGEGAFVDNQLTSVTIPDNVTIGDYAFVNNQLTSITIGANVAWYYLPFNNGFEWFYTMAGTYTRPDTDSTEWTRQ